MIQVPENGSEPHSRSNGVDPESLDDTCQVIETTTRDGQPLAFAVHAVADLTDDERAALGEIARRAVDIEERRNPHGGVIQELMQVSLRGGSALRAAGVVGLAGRLTAAIGAARAALDTTQAALVSERESRFRWAEEAAGVEAEGDRVRACIQGVLDSFEGVDVCAFQFCPGPDAPFESMRTCVVCAAQIELRALLDAAGDEPTGGAE